MADVQPFSSHGIEQLRNSFDASKGDLAQLKLISDELQHRNTPDARDLLNKVVMEIIKIKREAGAAYMPPLLGALLKQSKLDKPDGRPLHRYRLGTDDYNQLTALLRQNAARLTQGNGVDAALVVLWASAWYCREYSGGIRKYSDFNAAIGATVGPLGWPLLIERGLKWWGRRVVKRDSGRHWLLTIAVEGGFPVRVLQTGAGWLSLYLNQVVGRLLGFVDDPSLDDALAIADVAKDELLNTYRQEDFIALAADLALAIVRLRRVAENVAPGLAPSAVLDQMRPSWRDELPIATDTDAARTLVDGMLGAKKIARGLSGGAGCVRVLRRTPEGWRSGLRLSLVGEFQKEALAGLAAPGTRLGILPHGVLARVLGEELAFLDPPGDDGVTWRLRPLTRRTELEDVPLEARIDVLIQSPNGGARAMEWPGGAPERGDVVTFEIEAEDKDGLTILVLSARGSASLRAERAVVTAPDDWSVRWEDQTAGGVPGRIGKTLDRRALWLVDKSVLVESTDRSLLYRIQIGADQDLRDYIALNDVVPQSMESADDFPLYTEQLNVICYRGLTPTKVSSSELLWRQYRGDKWRELAHSRLPVGVIDIMWRGDAQTRLVRDRVRAAIIPRAAQVDRVRDGHGWRYNFQGFGNLRIMPERVTGLDLQQHTDNAFTLSFSSNPLRRVIFELRTSNSERKIRIALPFPLQDGIAHWNGKIVPPGSEITPAELADLVAFGQGRIMLYYQLKSPKGNLLAYFIYGDQELSLRPLADRVRRDLASAGIDAWVALSIGDGAQPWRIKLFDCEVHCANGAALIQISGEPDKEPLLLVGRLVASPQEERRLAEISHEDGISSHTVTLPENMAGDWWVYLRSNHTVRSRPSIVPCNGSVSCTSCGLEATTLIASQTKRQAAIFERLVALENNVDGTQDDIKWLITLIGSLDGVPASTFEALSALPSAPKVLARLLLTASDAAEAGVWRLEAELPFLWAALPLEAWIAATNALGRSVVDPLLSAGWQLERAAQMGKQAVDGAINRAASLDPTISTALIAAGLLPKPGLVPSAQMAAQGYVQRTYNRDNKQNGSAKQTSLFRTPVLKQYLVDWSRFDPMHLEALDAPIAVAAAAKFGVKLTPDQIRRCKEAAAADLVYFAEGIAAKLL